MVLPGGEVFALGLNLALNIRVAVGEFHVPVDRSGLQCGNRVQNCRQGFVLHFDRIRRAPGQDRILSRDDRDRLTDIARTRSSASTGVSDRIRPNEFLGTSLAMSTAFTPASCGLRRD